MKRLMKAITLLLIGGSVYFAIEILWRGHSHWAMFLLGGLCFLLVGGINEQFPWKMGIIWQALFGAMGITFLELVAGIILNKWLGLAIWDYSEMWGNVLGQICPQYVVAWFFLSPVAILLDDVLRWKLFNEEKPHYTLF